MDVRLLDVLTKSGLALTPSEAKIVQVLLTDYPFSGFGTATSLARKAGVSDPTVTRLVAKLGFGGFQDFQSKLLAEVEAHLHSPLLMMDAKRPGAVESAAQGYLESVTRNLERTRTAVPLQNYDRAVGMLWETKGRVVLLGGRFSRSLAAMLAGYLIQFRSGVHDLGTLAPEKFDILVDLGKRDLLVVFDYRRYQSDVVSFASQAAKRGVRILLFTDVWLSPIAAFAAVTMVVPVEADSPYDTMAPAVAQMEAVVAHGISRYGDLDRTRIEMLERIRSANAVTLGDPSDGPTAGAPASPGDDQA
ncbi:MurR/RpiR family transcriptional regulator (plasmid) [Skermanella sp. TT6]|uniref:MurR/RpiR family transcriptional regulator n=1 Tax=Skermanella cutis TaxID=2775420 RepID=A0ABX7BGZ7_9PROT|nr:MurR/RpiR family transcriptional regulator [Skermanella sp. TT6]QQP93354.1 MurR/RpiR family transcriptional regulator [Skermanella sp. TT6]